MVESVFLSGAQRQTQFSWSRINQARDEAVGRLATGRRVNKISDNPKNFMIAQALLGRAADLREAKSGIGQGISALQATQTGLQAIEAFTRQLKDIALAAQNADAQDLADLAEQFDAVRQQIDNLAGDASYQETNLISNPAGSLNVGVSDKAGVKLTIQGQASDVTGLGVGDAASYGNFATQADIDNAVAAIESAVSTARDAESGIVGNAAILAVREKFDGDMANILETGETKLTRADLNQEGARLMSANLHDQLSAQSIRIAARSDALIVDLLSRG